jgi:hypothetical protein
MKTFKQYLEEQLWSAIKLPDGTIKRGKFPHSSHEEIRDKHNIEITKDHKMGFVMVKDGEKTFMDRSEAAKHIGRQTDRADSTHLKPRDQINHDADDPFAGSYASPDQIKSNVLAIRKFGTTLSEGNPLSRMNKLEKEGRHFIAISTERPGLTKKQVAKRNEELMSMAREAGFGVRKTEGRYEGNKESSHVIHARAPGREAGAELVAFGRRAGKHFDQDSVLHHNGKTARLIGTNTTGFPGMDKSEKVGGELKYNPDEKFPFQTELRPSKKRSPARFTTE